jgi:chromate reductase, NAD(P)H dehydrogenase (quinone)
MGGELVRLPKVMLVSGSLRQASTNTALLRTAQSIAPPGIAAELYGGMARLPHFNPDLDAPPLHPAVAQLRTMIHTSDAILFSTPEYAGALPGSFKNVLDWTIGDDQPGSIYEKPVAWINTSASPTGAADAHDSLRKVLAYAHASIVESACATLPVPRHAIQGGLIADPAIHSSIGQILARLVGAIIP